MSSAIRYCGFAILVAVGLAGCTPAAFVQRARPAQPCEVQICTVSGASVARCDCNTREQMIRATRHGFWPHRE